MTSAVHVAKMNVPSCLEKMLATNVASYGLVEYASVGEQTTHHVFWSALESATFSRLAPSIPGTSKVWPTVTSPDHSRRWDTESYFLHLSSPLRKKLMESSVTPSA